MADGEDLAARPGPTHVAARQSAGALPGRWVDARHLRCGDVLLRRSGELVRIEGVRSYSEGLAVYNLRVAELETYAVGFGQILTHNYPTKTNGGADAAQSSLRADAMEIHSLAHPVKAKNQTIALNDQVLPDGTTRVVGSANSTAGLTDAQKKLMEQKGIEVIPPAPRSTKNHAEINIIEGTPEGTVSKRWGISWGKNQLPDPCSECAPRVDKFGGIIER